MKEAFEAATATFPRACQTSCARVGSSHWGTTAVKAGTHLWDAAAAGTGAPAGATVVEKTAAVSAEEA